MTYTLADAIEAHILNLMDEARQGLVEVRRRELADRFRCAPSQINYVLETRFTPERGFVVRSRRGSGGGLLINMVTYGKTADILRLLHRQAGRGLTQSQSLDMVRFFSGQDIITDREARLFEVAITTVSSAFPEQVAVPLRGRLIQSWLEVLMSSSHPGGV